MDLSFYLDPPDRTEHGALVVRALAPLSMVSSQPGSYYQGAPAPSDAMLLGMVENALGWHLGPAERKSAVRGMQKQAKKAHRKDRVGRLALAGRAPSGLRVRVRVAARAPPRLRRACARSRPSWATTTCGRGRPIARTTSGVEAVATTPGWRRRSPCCARRRSPSRRARRRRRTPTPRASWAASSLATPCSRRR